MPAVFLGVRHHSPACARLVASTIERLRPSYVLVEGPCDMNDRLDELLLGHELPVAVFSHYRDGERAATSWTPLCDYSPEWVALRAGRAAGAEVRFIDLPAWHPAFAERVNRYADAEARYAEATARLCARFDVDGVDALWDRLFEVADDADLRERLDTYFALVRGDTRADDGDRAREAYMASWVRAALSAPGDPTVLVVTGGFHQPALRGLVGAAGIGGTDVEVTDVRGPGEGVVGNRAGSVGAARDRTPDEGTADGSPPRGGSVTTEPSRPGGSPPDDPTPGNSAPGDRTPGGTTPDDPTSGGPTPDDATPDGPTPGGRVTTGPSRPGDSTPDNPTPGNSAPGGPTPDDTTPDGPTPGGSTADDEGRDDRAVGADGPVLGADGTPVWPGVPDAVEGALKGSFLVPYSFRQLDSFAGYESGMPSPGYYQRVWDEGVRAAADGLVRAVVSRLRARNHPVSTADLIAARALTQGLTALRDHPRPARTDVLDGMAGALIGEDLDQPLPWTTRGTLTAGAHPVVEEMIAASGGDRVGTLHPDTPRPPLVADVAGRLAALGLTGDGPFTLDLTRPGDLERSRVLHRLRVLGVPGHERTEGPRGGADPRFDERWETRPAPARDAALIEAGAYGASLDEAAEAVLTERARGLTGVPGGATARPGGPGSAPASPAGVDHGPDADGLARTLFDVVLCGVERLSEPLLGALAGRVRRLREAGPLGDVLATALGLWRHDRVFGTARSPLLVSVLDGAVERLLWLFEGAHTPGTTAPRPASAPRPGAPGGPGVDLARLAAVAAVRDTLWHASGVLSVTRETVTAVACRVSGDDAAPPDLRGAAFGLHRCLTGTHDPAAVGATVRALPGVSVLGDWLAGLFAVARDELTTDQGSGGDGPKPLIGVVDGMIGAMSDEEFLIGLPALRQAFAFFPPRERERIAERLLERRGVRGSARSLLRTTADPVLLARAAALEDDVSRQLDRYGLGTAP